MEHIENPMVLTDPEPERYPICPLCDEECETLFVADDGEVIGCENCVNQRDSWEVMAEQEQAEKDYWGDRKYDEWKDSGL